MGRRTANLGVLSLKREAGRHKGAWGRHLGRKSTARLGATEVTSQETDNGSGRGTVPPKILPLASVFRVREYGGQ